MLRDMKRMILTVMVALSTALAAAPAAFAGDPPPADPVRLVFEEANKAGADQVAQAKLLVRIELEIKANPKRPEAHFVRGFILSRMTKLPEALAAYDEATRLDPKFAEAYYNAGVILGDMKRHKEAIARFEQALSYDPKHIDAAYNAAQSAYMLKDFNKALTLWQAAEKLAPDDFDIVKKVLQAMNALGMEREAVAQRDKLLLLWKNSKNAAVRNQKEFVFDQFDVGKWHIYAAETFNPSGILYYVYTFKVAGADDKIVGTVNLESSAYGRETGVPFIVGMTLPGKHVTTGTMYKALPNYSSELKPVVIKLVQENFK